MSIKTRVGIALGIVLLLHTFTAVMGHVGLEKAHDDFSAYEGANSDTIRVLAIDKQIAELKRNVTVFMLTGNDSVAEHVRVLRIEAEGEMLDALAETEDPAANEILGEMIERIREYGLDFEKVAVDRTDRIRFVRDEMNPAQDQVLALLDGLVPGVDYSIGEAHEVSSAMLRAEAEALRYFDAPSGTIVEQALLHLSRVRRAAQELDRPGVASEVIASVDEYERAFLSAVQATWGYLHLVNVVLAGEAAELNYLSNEIRSQSLARRQVFLRTTQADAKRFQIISDAIAVLTVLAGIIVAALMTRALINPILSVTETFRRLARGESEATIEGVDRADEIGDMAKAAEVFRIKNIETERLLADSQRMGIDLEQRNNEMTQFVYAVSHDLKTPMVTIRGYTGVISKAVESGSIDDIGHAANRIDRASQRMVSTIEGILDLSKTGRQPHQLTTLDLNAVTDAVITDLSSQIETAGAVVRVSDDLPGLVADELRTRQIFQNLISNALIHGRPAEGSPEVVVTAVRHDHETVLSVADNGGGIEPKYRERIFQIFQRLDVSRPGTGVGLAIVKAAAEAHNGRVWIDADTTTGTTFHVAIPHSPAGNVAGAA